MADLQGNTAGREDDAMAGRFLTFLIGEETFGIKLSNVMEIVGIQPTTEMPEMPDYIKGIINLRGRIIPVMDVRLRLKKPRKDYDERTCVIVVEFGDVSIGLIVDNVSEVLTIPADSIAEKPQFNSAACAGYVENIGKLAGKVILLISCEKLLKEETFDTVSAQT